MFSDLVGRSVEFNKIAALLDSPDFWPAALVIEGEAGIGKSTLWLAAVDRARERGTHVLCARAWEAESVLAFSTVADLLSEIDDAVLAGLPEIQRVAVNRVVMRGHPDGDGRDDTRPVSPASQQVLAAAMLSIIDALARTAPVLMAIDDLQWLDPSSQAVVAFVVRRLRGPAALLAAERTDVDHGITSRWPQLDTPEALHRVVLQPLSVDGLQQLLSHHLGRSLPQPGIVRIAEVSGGNPFYALELARSLDGRPLRSDTELPRSLADVVRLRIGGLSSGVRDVLLVAASAADPTVEMISRASGFTVDQAVDLLEGSGGGVVSITGNRVRFTHPLLARGVYADALPSQRRRVHRALADIVTEPELRARHLALAATSPDPETLEALERGAASARAKGAPAEAAELLDLAISLGGDTPGRRVRAADNHIRAGDTASAMELLDVAVQQLPAGTKRAVAHSMRAAVMMNTEGYVRAVDVLELALADATGDPLCTAYVRVLLAFAQVHADEFDAARDTARHAVEVAEQLQIPQLLSPALAIRTLVDCLCGAGFDREAMRRALDLEVHDADQPVPFSAGAVNAVVLMWVGEVDRAAAQMQAVRDRLQERVADTELLWVSMNSTVLSGLRGRYAEAAEYARETVERGARLGGDHVTSVGLTMRGVVAAYTGEVSVARRDLRAAVDLARACRSPNRYVAAATLAFLEVSAGAHSEALAAVAPLLADFDSVPGAELPLKGYLPDAVEALVALGRLEEAEPLVRALEDNGRRLDRPWMLAVGARCRSMLLAARGDVAQAEQLAVQAMSQHDQLAMPFERARTQLLLGQLQRRLRRKQAAAVQFGEALAVFERLGAKLWAQRVRGELERTNVSVGARDDLTPSERRVAELAAAGMTNREMAAKLFISAKTVEANLTAVYRKLGIRSRAELGRLVGDHLGV